MPEPIEIAVGQLRTEAHEASRSFTLWMISENEVELRYAACDVSLLIRVDTIAVYEIGKAIEAKTGCDVAIDYARSRLTWSGGLRPVQPLGPLKTKRVHPPRRTFGPS